MNTTMPRASLVNAPNLVKTLLLLVFISTGGLSIKAAYDLTTYIETFPTWFVPSFILTITGLIAMSLYFVVQAWTTENHIPLLTSRQSLVLWAFMLLSFICTTSVHGFSPFQRNILQILPLVDSITKTNYAIGLIGFGASAVLTCVYVFGQMKHLAMIGLMLISLGMLIPNDNCANQFNYWWIETIGASPLMYVPNMYAALFVTCGLHGVQPKRAGFITMSICIASLLLGLGHTFGIIW